MQLTTSSCQGNFLQEPRMVNGLLLELPWSPEARLNDCPKHNHSSLRAIPISQRPSVANCLHGSQNIPCSAYYERIQINSLGEKEKFQSQWANFVIQNPTQHFSWAKVLVLDVFPLGLSRERGNAYTLWLYLPFTERQNRDGFRPAHVTFKEILKILILTSTSFFFLWMLFFCSFSGGGAALLTGGLKTFKKGDNQYVWK